MVQKILFHIDVRCQEGGIRNPSWHKQHLNECTRHCGSALKAKDKYILLTFHEVPLFRLNVEGEYATGVYEETYLNPV